ncbi:ATP-binding cassette domain-containing protein [Limosilactobacillus gastricus]|uniref:Multidrug resistance ABC transporter ATP-binding and permease protein n=1 Tax=Limosilactobacillus gastricus DSM 16045 TaxID=1423749 RepID=A0A0R1V715_9LACO|nr:Multidrug ABC transporter ATP-binding and permease component [Limosilactobacillus gastricus DSM 16045]QGF41277.1 ATP-binding cassette domain-containing protein [Limosilactobacillus gastricus]
MSVREKSTEKFSLAGIARYFKPYTVMLIIAALLSIVGSILNLIGPRLISQITNYISAGLHGTIKISTIGHLGMILAIMYALGFVFNYVQGYMMATIAQRVSQNMRIDISRKINRLPLRYFDQNSTGDILSRVTNDVDTVGQSMNQSLSTVISSLTMFFGSAIMMFATNWLMAIAGIVTALLGFAIMMFVIARSQKYFKQQQDLLGEVNDQVDETFSGHLVVKAYNGEQYEKARFANKNQRLYQAAWKSQFLSGMMMPMMIFVGNLAYVVVCIVGAVLAVQGSISFGTIVAFMLYIRLFTQPLQNLSQAVSSVQSMAAASQRVLEFMQQPELADESDKVASIDPVEGQVDFDHVSFGYDPDQVIIKDFNEAVQPGQKVAIVGPTGAGKTTIVNLLMRFYETNQGQIRIDGHNTADLKRALVHDQFAMVLQDTWLFEGALRDNLVYNREHISDQQLDTVMEAVGLTDLVEQLPKGYDTVLLDDEMLSAGQKQLITIARAMLKDAPLLILDEATSSVDTRTELKVQRAMDKLMTDKTSFVIAHRLSTIRDADLILVMNHGDVIESGTHEELLAQQGFYADLYNSQFEAG